MAARRRTPGLVPLRRCPQPYLSLVVLVVGAALRTAFAEETRFGLFPGEQSLLAEPLPSFTAAVRLDRLDAAFDAQGRPRRFDTYVTFLREGGGVRSQVVQVNDPGAFDGFLVHAWTYGPRTEMPMMQRLHNRCSDRVLILGVDFGEERGAVQQFVDRYGITYPILLDPTLANFYRWSPQFGLHKHYFVDANGVVLREVPGELPPEAMLEMLDELLAG